MRAAKVYMNKIAAGVLTENNDGSFTFRYEDDYVSNPACSSISLTLPEIQREYRSETLFPFFSNMLSEGVNRRVQARKFKIDEDDDFGLLMGTAQSDTIGAITIEKI
ncbi:phosphatidylinositol kinase [Bacteroidia bacterium]|nr:phosphatidylinositol kinase [Bacteroidia bacterium]GHV22805.1 phosphatidylinositol kinase [Bacteroidia bacterium]